MELECGSEQELDLRPLGSPVHSRAIPVQAEPMRRSALRGTDTCGMFQSSSSFRDPSSGQWPSFPGSILWGKMSGIVWALERGGHTPPSLGD